MSCIRTVVILVAPSEISFKKPVKTVDFAGWRSNETGGPVYVFFPFTLSLMFLQSDSRSSLSRRAFLAGRSECVGAAGGGRVRALLGRVCAGLLVVLGFGLFGAGTRLVADTASTSLILTWSDNSNNESGFKIERSVDGVAFSQLTTVGANVTTHTDRGLSFATRYTYRVSAYNSAGSSAATAAVAATTVAAPVAPTPNTAPTISDVANQTINAGSSTAILAFTIADTQTATSSLVVSAASSNPTLVPQSGLALGGSAGSRTIRVTPAAGQSGSATITLTVSDGTLSASDTFLLTVNVLNTAPTITDVTNRTINANANTGAISFTVADSLTAAGSLVLSATSSNLTLVPTANIVFGGSGGNRTVVVTPATNQIGSATLTLTVSDGTLTASDSFVLTVVAVNTAPTISDIANRSMDNATGTGPIAFVVGDAQSSAAALTVSGSSTNPGLISTNDIVFGGSGANRTITLLQTASRVGTATITVTVSDGALTAADSFVVTVNAVNQAPTVSAISARSMDANTSSGPIPFTVGDAETAAATLSVSASSSNSTLLPASGLILGGSGANRTLVLTPAAQQAGTSTITVTVSDGLLSANKTFVVTVNAVNTAPTISGVADRAIDANTNSGAMSFTVGDAETAAAGLTVTATSSNPTLLPLANVVFSGSGASRSVQLTPAANQTGSSVVSLVVSDGNLQASTTFILTVNAPVTAPTISELTARSIQADSSAGPIAFTIGHATVPVNVLTVSGASSNSTLVPVSGLSFSGTGAQRSLTVTPAAGQSGTATITVSVNDGTLSTTSSFVLTVTAINLAPTVSAFADLSVNAGASSGSLAFTIGDSQTAAGSLLVSGSSSNPTLLPVSNIVFGGSGTNRTVLLTPAPGQSGSTVVSVAVSDGALTTTRSFVLTVIAGNAAPTISGFVNRSIPVNSSTGAFPFTLGDTDSPISSLTVSIISSDQALLPSSSLVLGGSGSSRTLNVVPVAGQVGMATVTVTVSDGSLTASSSFVVTVTAVNSAPAISHFSNLTIESNASTGPIPFTVSDAETPASNLTVTATTSNPALVSLANVSLAGSGSNRTLSITPAANQIGSTTLTLTVSDGTQTDASSFVLTVAAPRTAPTITAISNRSVAMRASVPAISFTIGDEQTPAGNLTLTGSSSNPSLVPVSGLAFSGSGASRSLVITPAANQTGSATITVTVSNGTLVTGTSFVLTVEALNTAPTVSVLSNRSLEANSTTGAINLTVADAETAAGSLVVTGNSSNPSLVPSANIVFGGADGSRTVSVTPAADQSGTATITVTVSDGSLTSSASFVLTVAVVNTAPTISSMNDRAVDSNVLSVAIPFTVGDAQTSPGSLTVTGSSSNPTLLPNANLVFAGSGANRTMTLKSALDQIGTSTVTVTVSDGSLSSSTRFVVTVNRPNTAPTITPLTARSTVANGNSGAIEFTIGDSETPVNSLNVTGSSSNQTVLPYGNVVFGGTGANRTVTLTPAANQIGTTTITLTVSDGSLVATTSFVLTVTATSTAPKISDLPNRSIVVNGNTTVSFTVSDAETAAGSLVVTGGSTNTALVGPGSLVFGGSGGNRTVVVTPIADRTGNAVITLTVSDGRLTASSSFTLAIGLAGNTPTISRIANRTINANTNTGVINFNLTDANTPATSLTVTGSSSNPTLVPASGIALGGFGATRTVVVTPAANLSGNSTITLTVSDGTASSTYSFLLTVLPVNTPPTLSNLADRTMPAGNGAEVIGFAIDDADTALTSLTVQATSSNPTLLPNSALVLGGTGANRTLSATPVLNQSGVTTITLTVSDGSLSAAESFTLTVAPGNDAPTSIVPPISGDGGTTTPPPTGGGTGPNPTPTTALAITQQPESTTVGEGGTATLRVTAAGSATLTYQWYRGLRGDTTSPMVGANSATFITPSLAASGNFWVRVSSNLESLSSQTVVVSVVAGQRTFFGTVGAAGSGGSFGLMVRMDGTGVFLADSPNLPNGVRANGFATDAAGRFSFQSAGVGTVTGQISGGTVSGVIAGSIAFVGTQESSNGATSTLAGFYHGAIVYSADGELWVLVSRTGRAFAALVEQGVFLGDSTSLSSSGDLALTLRDGRKVALTVTADGRVNGTVTAAATIGILSGLREGVINIGRLVNMSIRATSGGGDGGLISGFTLAGEGSKQVLVRAIGPTLGAFGVSGVLADPMISLTSQGASTTVSTGWANDNWLEETVSSASQAVGAFPLSRGSKDAALLVNLPAGGYTAQVACRSGGGGAALIELYDTESSGVASNVRLVNMSIRTEAGAGDNVVITGFNVSGDAPKRLLIRAIGPELGNFGVAGALSNPVLSLYRNIGGVQEEVALNDDWGTGATAVNDVSSQVGAFPMTAGSQSAAMVVWVAPGTYTAIVRSGSEEKGVVIVELYEAR